MNTVARDTDAYEIIQDMRAQDDEEFDRRLKTLAYGEEVFAVKEWNAKDVLEICYDHPSYEALLIKQHTGCRSESLRNALECIWYWAAAVTACQSLGWDHTMNGTVRALRMDVEREMGLGGIEIRRAA